MDYRAKLHNFDRDHIFAGEVNRQAQFYTTIRTDEKS